MPVPEGRADHFPRVLVITANPFTPRNSNGLLLSSLFEGWDPDALAQIFFPQLTRLTPSFQFCRHYWALGLIGLRRVAVASASARLPTSRSRTKSDLRALPLRLARSPRFRRLALPVREVLYARASLLKSRDLDELAGFGPDLILSTLGSLSLLRQVRCLSDRLSIPVVPFITDDWVTTEYEDSFGGSYLRRRLCADFHDLVESAPARLVVSDAMAEEYARRYGGDFRMFTRCLDPDAFPYAPPEPDLSPLELVYTGQVSLGRWQVLKRIGSALKSLSERGVWGRLTVYLVPDQVEVFGPRLEAEPFVRVAGSVDNALLPGVLGRADILVHAESWDSSTARYTRFSLSGKIPEYLMAGRPILAVGPAELGTMRHVRASGAGVMVSDSADAALESALLELMTDAGMRRELGESGRAFGILRHEFIGQRRSFREVLTAAAGTTTAARPSVDSRESSRSVG